MTTAREIIQLGYREANFTAQQGVLTSDELSEGLTILQGVQDSLAGLVTGIRLTPWYVPSPQRTGARSAEYPAAYGEADVSAEQQKFPPANARLLMRNTDDRTIWFQFQPEDGAVMEYADVGHTGTVTLDANGALFGLSGTDKTVAIQPDVTRNEPRRWLYRMDYGAWLEVVPLTLDDEIPFPSAYNDYFITLMAIRLSPRFGAEPRQATTLRYREMMTFIRAQWMQSAPQVSADLGVPSVQVWDDQGAHDTHGGF